MVVVENGEFVVIEPSGFRSHFDKRENNQISD